MHRMLVIPILIFGLLLLMSCGGVKDMPDLPEITPAATDNASIPENDDIIEKLNEMTLDEKIGQLVIVGFEGETIDSNTKELIEKYHVGGVILFKKNIKSVSQTAVLINSIKEVNYVNKLPIFVSVDEEGGRVSRMPEEFKKIPSSRDIGEKDDENYSYQIGSAIGNMIGHLGFNMNFAPVLDINSNPHNKVIDDRALGSEPDIVKRLGISTMKGLQSKNIIPVIKHFPGHGDTAEDSHIGLPVINYDLDRLRNFEFIPFLEAIRHNADAVMIAHILMSKIDGDYPASMSHKVVSGILRDEMEFKGVVITDDLTMGAIEKNYDIGDAAVKSFNAGCDILLVCHGYEKELSVIRALKEAAENGEIPLERIDESVYRIIQLKNKYGLTDTKIDDVNITGINEEIDKVTYQ
ncbi:MAG TPA: beta-N-acetylhexosaminidase [Pseudobacteroides sp.]|nr:beta-N-acetylhexosaminidase [Pseudobacteroides sp.]